MTMKGIKAKTKSYNFLKYFRVQETETPNQTYTLSPILKRLIFRIKMTIVRPKEMQLEYFSQVFQISI